MIVPLKKRVSFTASETYSFSLQRETAARFFTPVLLTLSAQQKIILLLFLFVVVDVVLF